MSRARLQLIGRLATFGLASSVVIVGVLLRLSLFVVLAAAFVVIYVLESVSRRLQQRGWGQVFTRERRVQLTLLIVVGVVVAGLIVGGLDQFRATDRAFTIRSFDVHVRVEPTGRTVVEEELTVEFRRPRRGIIRELPSEMPDTWAVVRPASERRDAAEYYDEDGTPRSILGMLMEDEANRSTHLARYDVLEATLDGEPVRFRRSFGANGGDDIRLGESHITLERGTYTYRLRYVTPSWTFRATADADDVETRINAPGFAWTTRVEQATISIEVPGEVSAAACRWGPLGSSASCDEHLEVVDNVVHARLGPFPDHTGATISLHSAADGFVATPPVIDVPAFDDGGWRSDAPRPVLGMLLAALVMLPLVGLVLADDLLLRRSRAGAIADGPAAPTVLFTPPRGLSPCEVAGVLQRRNPDDLLLGEVVLAAQQGWVEVVFEHRSMRIERVPDVAPPADAVLAHVLPLNVGSTLSHDVSAVDAARTGVARRARRALRSDALRETIACRSRSSLRILVWILWLVGAAWLLFVALGMTRLSLAGGIGLLVVIVVGMVILAGMWWGRRPVLTPKGRALVAEAEAFDAFLGAVKQEELEWAATQGDLDADHPALALLPYAIAVGRADGWYERFEPLMRTESSSAWFAQPVLSTQLRRLDGNVRKVLYQQQRAAARASGGANVGSFRGGGGGGAGSGGGGGGGRSW